MKVNHLSKALRQPGTSQQVLLGLALTSLLSTSMGLLNGTAAQAYEPEQTAQTVAQVAQGQTRAQAPRAIAQTILRDAARRSGAPVKDLQLVRLSPKTFANDCTFNFGEVCNEIYKPVAGWEAIVRLNNQVTWTYHVNRSGSVVVLDPKATKETPVSIMPGAYIDAVIMDAARRAQVSPATVKILETKPMTFGNDCIFNFGEVCTKEYRPIAGYEMRVQVKGQTWMYHVDQSGSRVVIDPKVAYTTVTMPANLQDRILADAAKRSGLPVSSLKIIRATEQTFPNPCAFSFGEICTMEYRPVYGWEAVVQVRGKAWTYHIDRTGTQLVLDPKVATTTVTMPANLQNRILADAAKRSGLAVSSLKITQATEQTFSNPCVFNFGEICTREYRPIYGWEAVVQVRDKAWTYHIDRTGAQLVLDPKVTQVSTLPGAVQAAVLQDAKVWTQADTVRIVAAKAQTWGNDCAFNFGQICPASYQPVQGWQVTVSSGPMEWTYHTTQNGKAVVMDRRGTLPTNVADAIARDIQKRHGPAANVENLRFLTVKEQPHKTCFLFGGCRTETHFLAIASNGQQQWGYQSDAQGRRVIPMDVAKVQAAPDTAISQR